MLQVHTSRTIEANVLSTNEPHSDANCCGKVTNLDA